jgi:hypothetical protein
MREELGLRGLGEAVQIHEIQPVKFGGSPTDLSNKLLVTHQTHIQLNRFWNMMQRNAEGC